MSLHGALHKRRMLAFILLVALSAVWVGLSQEAVAQSYPDPRREVRHIMPWGAGGATDTTMRGFMQYLEKYLGVPVITENIPGGLSAVGMIQVKTARPDGYTIGTMTYDVLTVEFQGLAPVSWRDFELLGMVTEHVSALIVPADRWADLESFRRDALARPGSIKVGNVGTGGVWHQHAVAAEKAMGISLRHIPYEAGSGAQIAAILGGEVDAVVISLPAALPYVREGTLRVLGVMSDERDRLVPDAPTFREQGYDVVYGSFRIVMAPKGTPQHVLNTLRQAMEKAWHDPEFQAWGEKAVIGARWRDAEQTREYLETLAPRIEALMEELGLK